MRVPPSSNTPYSLSRSPLRTAISRTRTLCSLLPVKYCSAAPNASGATTRRSTWSPSWWRIVARVVELLDGPDAQLLEQHARGLRTEAADFEQDRKGGRQLAAELLDVAHRARRQVFLDARGQLLADAGQGLQPAAGRDGGDVLG